MLKNFATGVITLLLGAAVLSIPYVFGKLTDIWNPQYPVGSYFWNLIIIQISIFMIRGIYFLGKAMREDE